jgi:hypothetical protein
MYAINRRIISTYLKLGGMPATQTLLAISLSAAIGFVAVLSIEWIWGLYAIYQPVNEWLIQHVLIPGHSKAYYTLIYAHDLVVNVSLAYPFALILALVTPAAGRWKYLAVAVLVIFLWSYRFVLFGEVFFAVSPGFISGLAFTCGSLPLAHLLARHRWVENAA